MIEKLSTYFCRFKDVFRDDWQYEKAGCLILFVATLCILILPCLLACYIPFEEYSWWNTFEKFINEHPLFTSVMGTFIGVIIIFCILRPRVRIERQLIPFRRAGKWHLKVRVRNLGIFPVNNVEVQLLYYREVELEGVKTKRTKKLELLRSDSPVLRGVLPTGYDTTYGCATKFYVDELIDERKVKSIDENEDNDKEYEGVLCRVKSTHAISGVTYVREHKFEEKELNAFLDRYCSKKGETKDPITDVCTKINSDVNDMIEHIKDIKQNVEIIQKENKKNQIKMKRGLAYKRISNWFKCLFSRKK